MGGGYEWILVVAILRMKVILSVIIVRIPTHIGNMWNEFCYNGKYLRSGMYRGGIKAF